MSWLRNMSLVFLGGCMPLGSHQIRYGASEAILPLVHPQADKRRLYFPVELQGETWLFFLDTGYSVTTCDDGLIDALGVREGGKVIIRGEVGKTIGSRARLPAFHLGKHKIDDLVCVVRDLNATSSIRDSDEVRIGGVLGIDVLRNFQVELDPSDWTMALRQPMAEGVPEHAVDMKRELLFGRRIKVPVVVKGEELWPLLDTGASHTYLDASGLGLKPTRVRHGRISATGGNGSVERRLETYEASLRFGDVVIPEFSFTGRPRRGGLDGLLGLDVLAGLRQVYDFEHKKVWFETVDSSGRAPSFLDWQVLTEQTAGPAVPARLHKPAPRK